MKYSLGEINHVNTFVVSTAWQRSNTLRFQAFNGLGRGGNIID